MSRLTVLVWYHSFLPQSAQRRRSQKMLLGPLISLGFRGLVVASSCCTFSKVARSMMASCRSGKISQSSLGLSMRLWFLKDLVLVLKLITSPQ